MQIGISSWGEASGLREMAIIIVGACYLISNIALQQLKRTMWTFKSINFGRLHLAFTTFSANSPVQEGVYFPQTNEIKSCRDHFFPFGGSRCFSYRTVWWQIVCANNSGAGGGGEKVDNMGRPLGLPQPHDIE